MQALLSKIRQILKDRRTRRFFTRVVSSVAAIVIFVTTYALILPAITLEKTAACGIEEHQHSDGCYEKRLVCGQEESDGHHHDDSCYSSATELTCKIPEHLHSAEKGCYDADGNLVCELQEHVHDDSCYEEVRTLTCEQEEYKGHHHTDACYEKVLVCGKEVHTHSEKCFEEDGSAGSAADTNSSGKPSESVSSEDADNTGDISGTGDAGDTGDNGDIMPDASDPNAAEEALPENDNYVPELEPLDMEVMLNSHTDLYYFHAEEGEKTPANSAEITDWKKVGEETTLTSTDLVKMYLAYTIPAGSLNETNLTARYRLPGNIHLTDDQIKAINENENGITAGFKKLDPEYQKYLGAEAIEGDRTPDELLSDSAQEYISAVVRAENVYKNDKYIGQDLIFTFVPYTIEKNQETFDAEKNPVSAGEKITGWFACDFRQDQIDWIEEELQEETPEEIQDETQGELLEQAQDNIQEETPEETDQSADDPAVITVEKTAEIFFVTENKDQEIEEIKRTLKLVEQKKDAVSEEEVSKEETKEETQEFQSGTLTADGDGYKITLDYTEKAKIPENASLSVREITAETDKEAYEACLEQAGQQVAADNNTSVDQKASRFFDIEIVVTETDGDGTEKTVKIEPSAPVSVNIQIEEKQPSSQESKSDQSEPTILHFAESGVEQIDSTVTDSQKNNIEEQKTEIQFEAESFSVYGVVYTVDFSYQVNGKVYEFTMQGADSVSLRALIDALHVYKLFKKENTNASGAGSKIEAKVTNADLAEQASAGNVDLDSFMSDIKTVTSSNEELLVPAKVEEDTTAGKIKTDLKLFPTYPLGLKQSEVLALNAKEYAAGDWALISMKAFSTLETLTITMITGETFKIKVTDAQDAVMIGDQVQTISNPAGTTIDLFDYWIVSQDLVGRDGWGDLNQDWGGHPDTEGDNGYNLNGSGNNKGINSSDVDSVHGHALKFSPAWDGTVYNGTKEGTHRYYPNWDSGDHNTYYDVQEPWRSLNQQGKDGLNSYTGDADPFQGIVGGTLVNGYPVLTSNDTIGSNGESLAYLFDTGFPHAGKASYPDVNQLLYVDKEGYYTYDSRDYRADYNNGTFVLTEQTSDNTEIRGFWPFGTQNFWAGMHINTQFSMPVNGQVLNPSGEYKDMQFEFSGDDDTWLYVDGVLVGDGGGIHNRTEIDVNFSKGTVTVTGKKGGGHSGDFEETKYLDDIFTAAGKYNEDQWEEIGDGSGHKRFKPGTYHTFDMFYLERGGGESNLYIHYNLVSTADFTAHKSYYGEDETDLLRRDQFQFELIGLDGKYRSVKNDETGNYELVQADPTADAIMPHASGSGAGTVASPHYEDNVSTTLSNGDTVNSQVYITAVTEDGNVNFGSASISEMDMNEADHGNPPVYKYIIREIVPDDAVNQDGTTWASATDAQKAAGGFVKDQVTYDGTVYYMTGTVTSWTETNASGQEVLRHGISKTYYTDDTYSTVKSDVNFASFENRFTPDYGSVDFTKVDGAGEPLEGAEFTLYKDEACTIPAIDLDTEGHPVWTASSESNGKVSFDNVRIGTYYMKETTAPSQYALDETVYKVVIEDSKDNTKKSKITILGDEEEIAVTEIANAKTGKITVIKKWLNASGTEIDGGSNSATVWLKRKQMVAEESSIGSHIVTVTMKAENAGEHAGDPVVQTVSGDTVIIEWDDEWQGNFNWWLTIGNRSYDGWISAGNEDASGDGYNIHQLGEKRRLTITNVRNDEEISFTVKHWQTWIYSDDHWTNFTHPTITGSSTEPNYVAEEDTAFNNEKHTQVLSGSTWSHTWNIGGTESSHNGFDFPAMDDNGRNYLYYVVELDTQGNAIEVGGSPLEGYVLQGYSANNNTGVSNQGVITIYNRAEGSDAINVVIKKTDNVENSTNYLDGAVFKMMYRSDSSGTFTNVSNESVPELDSDSQFTVPTAGIILTGLVDGQYLLQEISPPSGYVITNSTPVTFTVSGGTITSTEGTITGVRYTAASETNDAEFIIPNEPGVALPSTGGPGTRLFTILGGILILGAGVLLWRRRRLI